LSSNIFELKCRDSKSTSSYFPSSLFGSSICNYFLTCTSVYCDAYLIRITSTIDLIASSSTLRIKNQLGLITLANIICLLSGLDFIMWMWTTLGLTLGVQCIQCGIKTLLGWANPSLGGTTRNHPLRSLGKLASFYFFRKDNLFLFNPCFHIGQYLITFLSWSLT
jgi:hypothetical protein